MPGTTDVVLHIGTNDIAAGRDGREIIDGLVRFAGLARAAGKRVFLTTITPSDAGPHGTPRAVTVRDEAQLRAEGWGGPRPSTGSGSRLCGTVSRKPHPEPGEGRGCR